MKKSMIRIGSILKHEYLRCITVGCIILFAILPLLTLAFHVTGEDWTHLAKNKSFWQSITNSLI